MPYNLTGLENADTISELAIFANTTTEGKLFGFFMMALFIIIIFLLKRFPFIEGVLASSFVCFILSAILVYGEYLSLMFALIFLVILALSALYYYTSQN